MDIFINLFMGRGETVYSIYLIPPVLMLMAGLGLAMTVLGKGKIDKERLLFAWVCIWWTLLMPIFISHHFLPDESVILRVE